jgi:hypothetical protein
MCIFTHIVFAAFFETIKAFGGLHFPSCIAVSALLPRVFCRTSPEIYSSRAKC